MINPSTELIACCALNSGMNRALRLDHRHTDGVE